MIELVLMIVVLFFLIFYLIYFAKSIEDMVEDENHRARYWEYKYYCMEDDHYHALKWFARRDAKRWRLSE